MAKTNLLIILPGKNGAKFIFDKGGFC